MTPSQMIRDARWLSRLVAVLALGIAVTGCNGRRPIRTLPSALVVLADARDIKTSDVYDGQVGYRVPEPYPGQRTIDEIRRRLVELGWHPRERDLLNPANTFAVTARWRTLQTATGDLIGWSEHWEDSEGDVVMYGFKYYAPAGQDPSSNSPMKVLVTHFRASTVRELEREAQGNHK